MIFDVYSIVIYTCNVSCMAFNILVDSSLIYVSKQACNCLAFPDANTPKLPSSLNSFFTSIFSLTSFGVQIFETLASINPYLTVPSATASSKSEYDVKFLSWREINHQIY